MEAKVENKPTVGINDGLLIPMEMITVKNGRINPATVIELRADVERQLIIPLVSFSMHGMREDSELKFPGAGAGFLSVMVGFDSDIFPAFWNKSGEQDDYDAVLSKVCSKALLSRLQMLRFDIQGTRVDGEYRVAGLCELRFEHTNTVLKAEIGLSEDLSREIAPYFGEVPQYKKPK